MFADLTPGCVADEDHPGLGELLEPSGEIRSVAHCGVVHAQVVADLADHDGSGVEPDANGQLRTRRTSQLSAGLFHPPLDRDRRQDCPTGVILMGHRRAEEGHEAVAKELIDRALVAVDLTERELEEAVEHAVHGLCADARRKWRRVALTTVSIVIGVALVVSGSRYLASDNEQLVRLTAGARG